MRPGADRQGGSPLDSGVVARHWGRSMFVRLALLFVGVFACSTSAIFIKSSTTHPFLIAAIRLLIAAVLLAPLAWRDLRQRRDSASAAPASSRLAIVPWRRTLVPAVVLGAHFISWTYGVRLTLVAQATLVVNLAPVAMPFFLFVLVGERINRREIIGTALAIAGVLVLTLRDAFTAGGDAWGNLVCVGSMLLFAWYLALGRRNRDFPSLWLYVVPVYALAGIFCLVAALPWVDTFAVGSTREWLLLGGLAVLPTIVGHSALNAAMRHLRGQVVSLCNVAQFVFAGIMAFLLFDETPVLPFYVASALAIAGVAVVVFAAPPQPRLR